MGLFDDVGHADVVSALEEYDKLGRDDFLARYGFGRAHDYVLWHDGRTYDSKAILGVARQYASGTAATSEQFSGGRTGAARLLTDLGFYVTSADPYDDFGGPVTGTWSEASEVGADAAHAAWAVAARDVLLQAAHKYRAVVTDQELSTQVMYRTGIRTDEPTPDWIADVLGLVAADCTSRGEPRLASLCVTTESGPVDGDTAQQRLACYRHFKAAGLPADGGRAARAPRAPRAPKDPTPRTRARAATTTHVSPSRSTRVTPPAPMPTCPTCYMALPATGVCDECG